MARYTTLVTELLAEAAVEAEIARRAAKSVAVQVVHTSRHVKEKVDVLTQGTILTLIGRRHSPHLSAMRDAVESGDPRRIQVAHDAVVARARDGIRAMGESINLRHTPLIVDVMYGRSWLAKHVLMAADTQVAMSLVIWSGGALDEKSFSVRAYPSKEGTDLDLEVVVILVAPALSEIERAVVAAVPGDLSDLHIQSPSVAWTTILTIADIARMAEAKMLEGPPGFRDRARGIAPAAQGQQQDLTTGEQVQQQQEDTRQQQQQQQQADTNQQQQQQQQQQAETNQQAQQQQQENAQQADKQEQNQHQQQQQQQRETQQQQQQQHQEHAQYADGQQVQDQQQFQQDRQAQTERQQEDAHGQRVQHAADTNQQREYNRVLDDEMRDGLTTTPFDSSRYATLLQNIDFNALDATQSIKALLRIREQLIKKGLG